MIQLLEGRVLVKVQKAAKVSPGGIIIPDVAQEPEIDGVVVAVGPGRRRQDGSRATPDVQLGQRVIFGPYIGSLVKIDGAEFLDSVDYKVVFEDNILAVYEG